MAAACGGRHQAITRTSRSDGRRSCVGWHGSSGTTLPTPTSRSTRRLSETCRRRDLLATSVSAWMKGICLARRLGCRAPVFESNNRRLMGRRRAVGGSSSKSKGSNRRSSSSPPARGRHQPCRRQRCHSTGQRRAINRPHSRGESRIDCRVGKGEGGASRAPG